MFAFEAFLNLPHLFIGIVVDLSEDGADQFEFARCNEEAR
jgi:hypothetical protein